MGRGQKREAITEPQVQGLKHFRTLLPLLESLHDAGCARDKAGNRRLHFDQYTSLMLLTMFNPLISSLRALQQASDLKKVQRKLGCDRVSLGSLSEAARVFDADLLEPILGDLAQRLEPLGTAGHRNLFDKSSFDHIVTLVDGTLLNALPRVTAAMWQTRNGNPQYNWRLHAQYTLMTGTPKRIDLTNGSGSGDADERAVLAMHLDPDHCYVMDRGYISLELFNRIHAIQSSYICRMRDTCVYEVIESRPLSDEAIQGRVMEDLVVDLSPKIKTRPQPGHPMRLITVKITPNPKRKNAGVRGGHASDGILRIATNLMEVPAEIIAMLYEKRWSIEVFFRFFKHVLGCRSLLSECENGIRIQTYCAIIACMLIALYTGRRPTLRTYEMLCYYFMGLADAEELHAHLLRLKTQS